MKRAFNWKVIYVEESGVITEYNLKNGRINHKPQVRTRSCLEAAPPDDESPPLEDVSIIPDRRDEQTFSKDLLCGNCAVDMHGVSGVDRDMKKNSFLSHK